MIGGRRVLKQKRKKPRLHIPRKERSVVELIASSEISFLEGEKKKKDLSLRAREETAVVEHVFQQGKSGAGNRETRALEKLIRSQEREAAASPKERKRGWRLSG